MVALLNTDTFKSYNTIMVQGCTSDAGKSTVVTGLCRLLARAGKTVAPFKPQTMALNSAVTIDGGEIGRAQALQAQACYLKPHSDMNPVLLKPTSDIGAQVILQGKAVNSMQAVEFHNYKKVAMDAVLDSYQRLSQRYQLVVVEGAGSPAEINLRENDIANMGFAEEVDCPVIIVADIDKGGVFAHIVGTLALLSETEQARVTGFIINRFRGDIKLLKPGLKWLEQHTNKPVLGVIPYLHDLYLDAEDAIQAQQLLNDGNDKILKVVVPVLPRISNHTDFDSLRLHPQVDLQFISIEQECPACDLIILPGSKNVIADLDQLKTNLWQQQLNKHLRYGGKVIGICGGYQMLGQSISDPDGIESSETNTATKGFNLLSINTTLEPLKQLKRVDGYFSHENLDQCDLVGYEIHCGNTCIETAALIELTNGQKDGTINNDNNVLGSYLHGLFDHPQACNVLLNWAGLDSSKFIDVSLVREQQLERLADCLEANIDSSFLNQLKTTLPTNQESKQCQAQ